MASSFATKVIKAARNESALHLTAKETKQLATELGQMSQLIMKVIYSDLTYTVTPEIVAGLATEVLFAQLSQSGLSIAADGKRFWVHLNDKGVLEGGPTLLVALEAAITKAGLPPLRSAAISIDGADLYKRLQELQG